MDTVVINELPELKMRLPSDSGKDTLEIPQPTESRYHDIWTELGYRVILSSVNEDMVDEDYFNSFSIM